MVNTKDQSNAIVYWVGYLVCRHCQYKDQSMQCIECCLSRLSIHTLVFVALTNTLYRVLWGVKTLYKVASHPCQEGRSVSFTLEVEFEFTTWAWVQATAETAFGSGLVVRSPGSVKALNQSTHNSLGHCRNVHLAVAGHGRMNFRQWLATAKWTFQQWPRELWVDWFNALIEPGDRTTRPPQNAISVVAWTQAQVVNSNSTSAVQDPREGYCVSLPSWGFSCSPVSLRRQLC